MQEILAVAVVAAAMAFVVWVDLGRAARVEYVTGTESWSIGSPESDASTVTGYALERRRLIVPGHHNASYRSIIETQQMLAGQGVRLRHVAYDNFPEGRDSMSTLPYRAWLATVAWFDHIVTSRPLPLAVEHAALYADPLLHLLLIAGIALVVGRICSAAIGATCAILVAATFPLASAFVPGAPDSHSLAWFFAAFGVLFQVAGAHGRWQRLWLAISGIALGLSLWTDLFAGEAAIAGVAIGAGVSCILGRLRKVETGCDALPWRTWGIACGAACLGGYLVEYFPGGLDGSISAINPLHALACAGLGELLHQLSKWSRVGNDTWTHRAIFSAAAGGLAVAVVPVARVISDSGRFLADDPASTELANHLNGTRAPGLFEWFVRDGMSSALVATILVLVVVGAAIAFLCLGRFRSRKSDAMIVALGPILIATGLAVVQLRWWSAVDALLPGLVAAIALSFVIRPDSWKHWIAPLAALLFVLPGALLMPQPVGSRGSDPLSSVEQQAVVSRDLAYWLGQHHPSGCPVVLTTPDLSEALAYFGGVRIVASFAPNNSAGLMAAARIASASTWNEASALIGNRQITDIVLPSWDPTLGRLTQMARQLPPDAAIPQNSAYFLLKNWQPPTWLGVRSYHVPEDLGGGSYSASVFSVQPEQDEIIAACRLADYFAEMGMANEANAMREKLKLYPRSLPALAALASLDQLLGDKGGYTEALQTLVPYLTRRANRLLPADRRISLAALLIQAQDHDAAQEQIRECLAAIRENDLYSLTTGQLVRLVALSDVLEVPFPDAGLRGRALALLPPTLRARVEASRAK